MNKTKNHVNWISLAGIWSGGIVSIPALFAGSIFANSLSFYEAVFAGILGFGFVVAFMSVLSVIAVGKRVHTVSLASLGFGRYGARYVVGLVIGLSTLGWFGVQSNITGASFSHLVVEMGGVELPVWLSSSFWGIIMVLTAVFGFNYLKWLNYVAIPAIVFLLIYALSIILQTNSFESVLNNTPQTKMPFLEAIGVTIGFIAVGGVISADYNRYAKKKKDAILASIVGVFVPSMLLLIIGMILAVTQGTHDIVKIFASLGFPFFAMSVLILATWTSNVMNIYSSGLAFTSIFSLPTKDRPRVTLILGFIGVMLAVLGILNYFVSFLKLLTITITPIAGVMIASHFKYLKQKDNLKINWTGIISWIVSISIMLLMESNLKYIVGLVLAMLTYPMITKVIMRIK